MFDVAAVTDTIALCRELNKPYAVVVNAAGPWGDRIGRMAGTKLVKAAHFDAAFDLH